LLKAILCGGSGLARLISIFIFISTHPFISQFTLFGVLFEILGFLFFKILFVPLINFVHIDDTSKVVVISVTQSFNQVGYLHIFFASFLLESWLNSAWLAYQLQAN